MSEQPDMIEQIRAIVAKAAWPSTRGVEEAVASLAAIVSPPPSDTRNNVLEEALREKITRAIFDALLDREVSTEGIADAVLAALQSVEGE